jgi:hypothetical protein
MTPETVQALAAAQGFALDAERARQVAAIVAPVIATVEALVPTIPFEAEPCAYQLALEATAE